MILNFNDWGELTIDLDSLGFWISSGEPSDEHTPTGARIEIDHENVYIKLTPENAERLAQALIRAKFEQEVDPDNFSHIGTDFVPPGTWET